MKSSTFSRSAQRNLNEQPINATFKASSQLHNALMKEYKRPENSMMPKITLVSTGKESVKQARKEKEKRILEQTLQSEVASLPKLITPIYREQTHILVENLNASRRERKLKLCDDFDKWVGRLTKNIDEAYKDIRRDISEFIQASDKEITTYYDSLTDDKLLEREIEFVESIRQTVNDHEKKREDKVRNLEERLENLEKERERSLELFCSRLTSDISFQQDPEMIKMQVENREQFIVLVQEKREQNLVYLNEVNTNQRETFKLYKDIQIQKEQRWRDLKHQYYIESFNKEIQQLEYIYPDQRVELYKQFKNTSIDIYRERKQYLEKLNQMDIGTLTKSIVEKWIEETKQYNELASQAVDTCCNNLLKESEQTYAKCTNRYDQLKQQLFYAKAKSEEELNQILEEQFLTQINQLNSQTRDLMAKAIEFFEKIDSQQSDILSNYGQFYSKIAIKNDEYKTEIQLMHHNYEIMKAQAADKNDEMVEDLKKQLTYDKQNLIESLHHPKLDENLEICYQTLQKLQQEYERFHQDNVSISQQHPKIIFEKHQVFEKNLLTIFEYGDPQKEQLLLEKFKRANEIKMKYQIAKEEYLKKIEEEKAIEEAKNKKGGKAPASKPKDPKKFQQELEERMKQLLKEFPIQTVEKYDSQFEQHFIQMKSTEEIVVKMYYPPDEQENIVNKDKQEMAELEEFITQQNAPKDPKAKPQAPPPIELPTYIPEEDVPPKPIDYEEEAPKNILDQFVLEKETVIQVKYLTDLINQTKQKVMEYLVKCMNFQQEEGKNSDDEFLKESETRLQQQINQIDPEKQNIKDTLYTQRSQQIAIHKKRYERYAKQLVERIDNQTEQINFYLEGGLLDMKEYVKEQQNFKTQLGQANTLAKLQGIQNSAKETYFKFGEKISDLEEKLTVFANQELDLLLQKNKDYIRDCTHQSNGGEYSTKEIEWYQSMMDEHNNTINKHKQQRNQRLEEIKKVLTLKKQEQLDKFEQEYAIAVEDLAAKDGTGKKYGKPKRIAQEKLRTEMTKCEKAQESINYKFQQLKTYYEEYQANLNGQYFSQLDPSFSLKCRRTMMGLLQCIKRYATHIEALKPDNKSQEMPRVTWRETKFDTVLEQDEQVDDKKFIELEFESLGPLYYNGEKKFQDSIAEIERIIKEEAIKIYADKPKFITGADKIPDYLRNYIENMNRNMVEFRISSIRDLRNTCEQISEFTPKLSEMVLKSNSVKFYYLLRQVNSQIWGEFKIEQKNQDSLKQLHLRQLRPNLANPQCKEELDDLKSREDNRLNKFLALIQEYQKNILNDNFIQGEKFLKVECQNFEFLLLFYDSLLLFEDFVKLPGDEQIQKKHQNIKVSLRQRQSGQVIDTNSERSLSKQWDGILLELFSVEEHKIEYVWQQNQVVKIDPKEAKQGGKQDKKPGKQVESVQPQSVTHTSSLKSFKTYRQKSAKSQFYDAIKEYTNELQRLCEFAVSELKILTERELKFQFKWEQSINSL